MTESPAEPMAANKRFAVNWIDSGRDPTQKPNPDYPHGIDIDGSNGERPACKIDLPYPAKRIGQYVLTCRVCDISVVITTAGRPDDPRSVVVVCKPIAQTG